MLLFVSQETFEQLSIEDYNMTQLILDQRSDFAKQNRTLELYSHQLEL